MKRSEGYICVGRKIWYAASMDIDVILNLSLKNEKKEAQFFNAFESVVSKYNGIPVGIFW